MVARRLQQGWTVGRAPLLLLLLSASSLHIDDAGSSQLSRGGFGGSPGSSHVQDDMRGMGAIYRGLERGLGMCSSPTWMGMGKVPPYLLTMNANPSKIGVN